MPTEKGLAADGATGSVRLVRQGDRYVAAGNTYPARDRLRRAGFRWDPKARTWWTDSEHAVERFRNWRELQASSRATDADIDLPSPPGLSYYGYQRAGISFALSRRNALIADEMGLGKTIQAVGMINASPEIVRVLVVCPATLKGNWARETAKWLARPLTVAIASAQEWPAADIVIANYDILTKIPAADRAWDLLVLDEAHYIKNRGAQRTKAALAIPAERRIYLTGTPLLNRPAELWTLIHSLDPAAWPSWWGYAKKYCGAYRSQWGWEFGGATNLEELQERLRASVMIRRLKRDVLADLPPKLRQLVEISANGCGDLLARERDAWNRHEAWIAGLQARVEIARADDDPDAYRRAVKALREGLHHAFAEISAVRHETALAKAPHVIDHLQSIFDEDPERKIVCFAHHKDVIARIADAFPGKAVTLTGDTPQAERMAAVDKFQADPEVRLFVGSTTAAGLGITLTASSHVVFAELDWTPARVAQAEDRLHRIGQRSSVLVQHVVLENSLDARMAKMLLEKQSVADAALDTMTAAEAVTPIAPAMATRQDLEREAERADPGLAPAVLQGLRLLAGMDPDRAFVLNEAGFNRLDTRIGHELAQYPILTPKQAALGRRILLKYHRQLPPEISETLRKQPEQADSALRAERSEATSRQG